MYFHRAEEAFLRQTQDKLGSSWKRGAGCRFQLDSVTARRKFIAYGDEMEGGEIVDPGIFARAQIR